MDLDPSGAHRLSADLGAVCADLSNENLEGALAGLRRLLQRPNALAHLDLERHPHAYSRNFLFGVNGISAWAMVWAPGAKTTIHDHHCSCCFAVFKGEIREAWFRIDRSGVAVPAGQARRREGYVAGFLPSQPGAHQMINASDMEAITIHVYGFDPAAHASSIRREYPVAC